MNLQCPHCASRALIPIPLFTPLLTGLGVAGGIATTTAVFAARNANGVIALIKTPAFLAACAAAGRQGAVSGKKLGAELDQKHFPRFRCGNCLKTFSAKSSFRF